MNIINRLKNDECSREELLHCLKSKSPTVMYETVSYIVRNRISDKEIVNQLIQLSNLLDDKYKMLGYYKIGHVAMGTLLKLGLGEEMVFRNDLDAFEKEMAIRFSRDAW